MTALHAVNPRSGRRAPRESGICLNAVGFLARTVAVFSRLLTPVAIAGFALLGVELAFSAWDWMTRRGLDRYSAPRVVRSAAVTLPKSEVLMQRKTLNKGDALWKQGEIADSLAIVESGKLGVMTDRRLTGIVWKGMVIGESAILSTSGRGVMRSAAVFALADGVSVKEIPAEEVKAAFDAGDRSLAMPVLITLVGEICRNSLLLIYSSQNRALVTRPMKALMEATIDAFRDDSRRMHDWTDFTTMVALLVASRDYTERMRAELGVDGSDRAAITKASDAIREVFKDHEALEAIQATIEAEIDRESLKASLDPDKVFEFVVRG